MGSVVLKNVCKSYGDIHVIRDVSLEILMVSSACWLALAVAVNPPYCA